MGDRLSIGDAIELIMEYALAPLVMANELAVTLADRMTMVSLTLMDIFLVIMVVYAGLKMAVSNTMDSSDFIFGMIKMVVFWAIIYWMVNNYSDLIDRFFDGFDRLNQTIAEETLAAGQSAGLGEAAEGVDAGSVLSDDAIAGQATLEALGVYIDEFSAGLAEARSEAWARVADASWRAKVPQSFRAFVFWLYAGLLQLVAIAFVMLFLVLYTIVLVTVMFMKAVVVAVGPLMLMFFLVPYLSFLSDGWVRSAITVGLTMMMITIVMSIFGGVMWMVMGGVPLGREGFEGMTISQLYGYYDFQIILPLIFVTLIGGYMMLQAPQLAEMMMNGRQMGMAMGRGASQGAQKGGAAANAGARSALNKMRGRK
ncbi:TrbL/VirB6 plasmid conjugal transfer protein (plasmid) [Thioalkalivibrio sp. K90mix]|uniref:type IV secretion system protein n=1 Tax=Thioalkalivibrio sp. (strain K90mix) TaxID=396595 RepID=UPI000195A7B3|nr:type IV secretion system protein [Thioalkalivibrio sp. K90mix]ADC73308.1 TrbL/VirB6 plasmid conjugal transfer protein [Thioalkalivibrio sp. K90mix]